MTFTDVQPGPELCPDAVLTFRQWCELVGVGGEQDRVMNFKEWVKAAGISEKCGRYLIERGDGPPIVRLGPKRIGIRVCDHRTWLTSRTRNCTRT
jgi:predicted DNA-binding transcriptional regulator AlpA